MAGKKQKRRKWLEKHRADGFVRRAAEQGYRTRAVYKLQEIDRRDELLSGGMRVLELGAAPGGWSQYVARRVGQAGLVVAVDLAEMAPVENVRFVRGDFMDPVVRHELIARLEGKADLVLSDMAPDITGVRDADQARFLALLESVGELAEQVLQVGGNMLVKVFEGPEISRFRARCASEFRSVQVRKPAASRSKSREYYILARGLHTRNI